MYSGRYGVRQLIRTFIAAIPDEATCKALSRTLKKIDCPQASRTIRWLREANWHLTMKFLGNIELVDAGPIATRMREICAETPIFDVTLCGLFPFPPKRNPRVVAAGISEGCEALTSLAHRLDQAMTHFGIRQEPRSFKPHLTLGRVKSSALAPDFFEQLKAFDRVEFGTFAISELVLLQSELDEDGAEYTPLARGALA